MALPRHVLSNGPSLLWGGMRTMSSPLSRSSLLLQQSTRVTNSAGRFEFNPQQQRRQLSIHEYQGQELMREIGIRVPNGKPASSAEEARDVASSFFAKQPEVCSGPTDVIVKAQVLAGGRGLGFFDSGLKGGVHICSTYVAFFCLVLALVCMFSSSFSSILHSFSLFVFSCSLPLCFLFAPGVRFSFLTLQRPEEAQEIAGKMIGHKIFTKQTGPEGKICPKVYIAERMFIRRETYFGLLMDRAANGPVVVGSARGGSDIETLSKEHPNSIFKVPINITTGITDAQCDEIAVKLGFNSSKMRTQAADVTRRLYDLFIKYDCTLVEVNPLVESHVGDVVALDAKINFDANALYRQPKIEAMRDKTQEDWREVHASEFGLNYIQLDGNIGCLVNGAGLAMATMDMIKLSGGEPANFLDVGGGATEKQVTEAFKIFNSDKNVKAILVNIFGGIMRCDIIAYGILNAVKLLDLKIPLVVRLAGTNVKEAVDILENSGLRIIAASDLDDAAKKAVKVAKIMDMAEEAKLNVSFELPL
ncbi:Succinate--CoA ligase [ADP-forming] subunit beta, variant 2 [Balamuthia mandrillaris]